MPVQNNSSKARMTILLLLLTTAGLFAYEYHRNQIEPENLVTKITKDLKSKTNKTSDKFEILRDTSPVKNMSKSTQVITKMEGENTTTIKMEDGKVVDVEVNGEKIDESEYDKYVGKDGNTSIIRKRRGNEEEDFEFNTEEFIKNMPFFNIEKDIIEGNGQRFGFSFKDMDNFDSLFTSKFKNLNFNFDHHNLDSLFGGRMKVFGFGDDMKEFKFDMDSLMKGFKFELDDFEDDPMVIRRRPKIRQERGDIDRMDGERSERDRTFEFMKPEKMMLTQVLEKQLKKDGLLKTGKVNKVELNHKQLKINGEKMPEVIFEKYKTIYENETGLSLAKGNNVIFEVDHKEKNSKEYKTF